jgi:hypothetical protein
LLASLPKVADRYTFSPFVYPAPAAAAMAPIALLPFTAAALLFLGISIGAVCVALRVLGVTDRRCYGAALVSIPVLAGLGSGAFSPLLLLGVALAWRYRDRAVLLGLAVAAVAVAKMFLWPLFVWLVVTRRFRAAAIAAASATAVTLAAWGAIGFAGAREYPSLIARLTGLVGPNSYSVYAALRSAGIGPAASQYLPMAAAAVLVWSFRRRGDAAAFVAAIAGALLATPILWPHYLALLFVPVGIWSRRFGVVWLLPVALWLDPRPWSYGRLDRILPELALCISVLAWPSVVHLAQEVRTASTSSAWVSGFTFRKTFLRLPSSPTTNVERSTPM